MPLYNYVRALKTLASKPYTLSYNNSKKKKQIHCDFITSVLNLVYALFARSGDFLSPWETSKVNLSILYHYGTKKGVFYVGLIGCKTVANWLLAP